jgi:hypothetical protein
MKNSTHNHSLTLQGSHSALRKLALTSEVKQQIATQTKTKASSQQILHTLRAIENEEDLIFKIKNIYNQRQSMRYEALSNLTSTQALLKELGQGDSKNQWFLRYYSDSEPLERMFFARSSARLLTSMNWEVLIIDSTYKINRFFMPLCIISGVTALNISFYVVFAFLFFETCDIYK